MELVEGETLEENCKNGPLASTRRSASRSRLPMPSPRRTKGHHSSRPEAGEHQADTQRNGQGARLRAGKGARAQDLRSQCDDRDNGRRRSAVGVIVGTPGYMSPEQARGKDVDSRTDIWAFGCVLFEMLTGRQAFTGETITDVLANIVSTPPDLDLLPKSTPRSIRLLLTSALNKNSSQRLQHIGDTRLFLDGPLAVPPTTPVATASRRPRGTALILAALVIIVAGAGIFAASSSKDAGTRYADAFRNRTAGHGGHADRLP